LGVPQGSYTAIDCRECCFRANRRRKHPSEPWGRYGRYCGIVCSDSGQFDTAIPGAVHPWKSGKSNRQRRMSMPHTHCPAGPHRARLLIGRNGRSHRAEDYACWPAPKRSSACRWICSALAPLKGSGHGREQTDGNAGTSTSNPRAQVPSEFPAVLAWVPTRRVQSERHLCPVCA
jgi:hypothetical protein